MSNNHADLSATDQQQEIEIGSLPPRHTKHSKGKKKKRKKPQQKGFPLIQILLLTFLSLIAAIILILFYQELKDRETSVSGNPGIIIISKHHQSQLETLTPEPTLPTSCYKTFSML